MFLLSVSVHPAMAAESINAEFNNCASCGSDDLNAVPGFEGKKVPTVLIREISPTRSSGAASLSSATVAGTQKQQVNSALTLDIQNPFADLSSVSTAELASGTTTGSSLPAPIIENMSGEGYTLTGEKTHRYESTVTSDDFLPLNTTQWAALTGAGFTRMSADTVRSYRDVTYYAFTNQTTGSHVFLVAVQRLDSDGEPLGDSVVAFSPEISASGSVIAPASAGIPPRGGCCLMEWLALILAVAGLIAAIVVAIALGDPYIGGNVIAYFVFGLVKYGFGIDQPYPNAYKWAMQLARNQPVILALAILTGILLLLLVVYLLIKLGLCMGWWGEDNVYLWNYQYRLTAGDKGRILPCEVNDRIALALPIDTTVDKDARWEVTSHSGITILDETKAVTENGTIQMWFMEAVTPGSQQLEVTYRSSQPVPPSVPGPEYTIDLSVAPAPWKIMTIENTGGEPYPSLVIDHTGTVRLSYYNQRLGQVMYGQKFGSLWTVAPVTSTDGTASLSLAVDRSGHPAISFGDGFTFGNLMYATNTGNGWNVSKVYGGTAGNAGQYSSLAFDPAGNPRISYNDGLHFATLVEARYNGSEWQTAKVDTGGLTGDTGYGSSLAIDTFGHSHIAYTNGKYVPSLMYATDADGSWAATTVDNGGGAIRATGYDPSLALDSHGAPHIAYYSESGQNLRYASLTGTGWTLSTIEHLNNIGMQPSLVIDAQDRPHISYYDATNKELKYATYDTTFGQWVIRTVDRENDAGSWSSLALDTAGHPAIAYYDATNHELKFAAWTS